MKPFGWRVTADNAMGYRTVDTGSIAESTAVLAHRSDRKAIRSCSSSMRWTSDAAKVEQLGGQILIPPDATRWRSAAIVLDTEGLSLGLMQRG
jgi:predicted enzyme related to lactoylglutathione lyase